jgi:hypothetical protein
VSDARKRLCGRRNSRHTRYLDSLTAATITVSAEPWVFARERPDIAVNVRDYLSLYALEVNRSGERRTYLLVRVWSTVNPADGPPEDPVILDIAADDRVLSVQPVSAEPRTFGVGEPIADPRSERERTWYYPVDPEVLTYISAAQRVSATLRRRRLSCTV